MRLIETQSHDNTIEETRPQIGDDLLFGAQAIADELGLGVRKTFYLLERGHIPATKAGQM